MHSVHFFGLMIKVPPFSEIATFGHSASQAEHPVHWEAMIFKVMIRSPVSVLGGTNLLCGRDQRTLANRRVSTFNMLDRARLHLIKICLEPDDR